MSAVQIQLNEQQRQTILDAFEAIAQALSSAKQEVPEGIDKHTVKIGAHRLSFINESLNMAAVNHAFVPTYYTLEDVVELKEQNNALHDFQIRTEKLLHDLKSINNVARPSLYRVARSIYRNCKVAAADGISGASTAADKLAAYFKRNSKSKSYEDKMAATKKADQPQTDSDIGIGEEGVNR